MAKKIKIVKKKQKWKLLNLNEEIPSAEILGTAHIELFGNSKISIDGCLGVYEYKDTYLKLRLTKGTIIICGCDFNIIYFENRVISVKGKISAIEFV
ncbi:MAG: YabP/YqfC family sporulation protein [Clostridia bacterium]|nr:YabP/YqfC family sporulation protein [Clostridia bacterium]